MVKIQTAKRCLEFQAKVSSLMPEGEYILLDWPDHSNVGDHMIWLGEKELLKNRLSRSAKYLSSLSNYDGRRVEECSDIPILFHGGGNFGDIWSGHQEFRERVTKENYKRQIIWLPQSVQFLDSKNLLQTIRSVKRCKALTIFVRDEISLDAIRPLRDYAKIELAIDSAYFLAPWIGRLASWKHAPVEYPRLLLLRDDRERCALRPAIGDGVFADWCDEDSWSKLITLDGSPPELFTSGIELLADTRFEFRSVHCLLNAIHVFRKAGRIVTDRLHGYILADMMSIPVDVLDNFYGKIQRFRAAWGTE